MEQGVTWLMDQRDSHGWDIKLPGDNFTIFYNKKLRGAVVVSYELTKEQLMGDSLEARPSWRVDKRLPRCAASVNADYTGSGYDKGHLASDASFDKNLAMLKDTYCLSNAVPMARRVNRYYWYKAERLERLMAHRYGEISVKNIVEYEEKPQSIGECGVAIPKSITKVIEALDKEASVALRYINVNDKLEDDKLRNHIVPIEKVRIPTQSH